MSTEQEEAVKLKALEVYITDQIKEIGGMCVFGAKITIIVALHDHSSFLMQTSDTPTELIDMLKRADEIGVHHNIQIGTVQ